MGLRNTRAIIPLAALFLAGVIPRVSPAATTPGDDLEVRVRANPNRVTLGEEVHLTVEVYGGDAGEAQPPDLSLVKDFQVVGSPSIQTRFQWINGKATHTRGFRYILLPERQGVLEFPPLRVRVGNRTLTSEGFTLQVDPPGQPPGGSSGAAPSRNGSSGEAAQETGPTFDGKVTARVLLDKTQAFPGEQVTLKFLVESAQEIRGLELLNPPEFRGFWVEKIPTHPNRDTRRVRRDGRMYIEYTVMKRALFPSRSGELVIEPVSFAITLPRRSRDPFRSFFFESREKVHRRTQRLTLPVVPLPEKSRPEEFRGAVGEYRISVRVDRYELEVNDAVTLKVTMQGKGNLNMLEPPLVEIPSEFKRYDPKIEEHLKTENDVVGGTKTWEYVLVPRLPGTHTIPPVRFAYFDPDRGRYRVLRSTPVVLKVKRGEKNLLAGGGEVHHGALVAQGQDIHFIKTLRGDLRDRSRPLPEHPLIGLVLILPAIWNGALFLFLRRKRHRTANRHLFRRRSAWSRARKSLQKTSLGIESAPSEFYRQLARSLTVYLADKFDQAPAGLTRDRSAGLLAGAGVSDRVTRRFLDCLEACDRARFGDPTAGRPERTALLAEAERLLAHLEKCL